MNAITVLLSEDHMILRDGLRSLLAEEQDIRIVGEATNGRQAVELCQQLHPQVVVMDIGMPLLNGMEATRQILRALPATKVLILSGFSDPARINEVMEIGAAGYLIKQSGARHLPSAIRAVHQGNTFFSHAVARGLETQADSHHPAHGKASQLTSRESEVLQLVAESKSNKEIAAELHISVKTVEKHRQSLMQKVHVHDTAGLTRYAIDRGVIATDARLETACLDQD